MHALRDKVADYRQRVARSEEGYNARFGDAYRAFPRVARSLARSHGFSIDGPPRRGDSLAAEAVRQHVRDATEAHEDARTAGHISSEVLAGALQFPGGGALVELADEYFTLQRNEERAMAGLADVGAVREERARLEQSVAHAILTETAGILLKPAIQQLERLLADPSGPFMEALRERAPALAERAGPVIAKFVAWLTEKAASSAAEGVTGLAERAGAPRSDDARRNESENGDQR